MLVFVSTATTDESYKCAVADPTLSTTHESDVATLTPLSKLDHSLFRKNGGNKLNMTFLFLKHLVSSHVDRRST